jgi:hypothetical protein
VDPARHPQDRTAQPRCPSRRNPTGDRDRCATSNDNAPRCLTVPAG